MFSTSKKVLIATAVAMSMSSMVQAEDADYSAGAADYAAGGCAACHGVTGTSMVPIYPNLAGQKAAYTVKQLKDFQSGVRKDPTMAALANLVIGKEQAIADFLAAQKQQQ